MTFQWNLQIAVDSRAPTKEPIYVGCRHRPAPRQQTRPIRRIAAQALASVHLVPALPPNHSAPAHFERACALERPSMSAAVTRAPSTVSPDPSLSLAGLLILAASDCVKTPSDPAYADALLVAAFQHLRNGMAGENDGAVLNGCADAITECGYLSGAVRRQVAPALRGVADGTIPSFVALELISAAASRHATRMMLEAARAIGSDGLDGIAEAIALLAPATKARN